MDYRRTSATDIRGTPWKPQEAPLGPVGHLKKGRLRPTCPSFFMRSPIFRFLDHPSGARPPYLWNLSERQTCLWFRNAPISQNGRMAEQYRKGLGNGRSVASGNSGTPRSANQNQLRPQIHILRAFPIFSFLVTPPALFQSVSSRKMEGASKHPTCYVSGDGWGEGGERATYGGAES